MPEKDHSARSPFAGCAILITAVGVMVFLIGFSVFTLFRQFGEIEKFTSDKPSPVEITSLDGREPELNEFAERVEKFRQELAGDSIATLSLSADDMNLAIASHKVFDELRGTFRITGIDAETMRIAISFPLNGKPRFAKEGEPGWIASDSRYLNGSLIARPQLLKKEIILSLDTIEVPGAVVAQGFIDQMSPYRITERYLGDNDIGRTMAKLTRVGIADGKVVLTRDPNEKPIDMITNEEVDSARNRLFTTIGIAASVFLAFAAVIVLLGVRAKARKARDL